MQWKRTARVEPWRFSIYWDLFCIYSIEHASLRHDSIEHKNRMCYYSGRKMKRVMNVVNRVQRVRIYFLTLLSIVVTLTSLPLYAAAAEADGPRVVGADSYSPDLVSITYDQPIAATGDNTISDTQLAKFSFGDPSIKAVYGYVAHNRLMLTLNKAVARNIHVIDIDAEAGAVTSLTGHSSDAVNDYRVITLSGRLKLQDELGPNGTGITLDRIVKRSKEVANLVGAPGIDREDIRFALTLMDTSIYIYALQSMVPYAESRLTMAAEWNVPAVVVESLQTEINEAKTLLADPAKTQRQLDAAYLELYYAHLLIVPGPQVYGSSGSVVKGDPIAAGSTHDGVIYLVPASQAIGSVADLEQYKVLSAAVTSGVSVQLSSAALTIGESYKLYAVNADNRISEPSDIITITATAPAPTPTLGSNGTVAHIRVGISDNTPFVYVPVGTSVGELLSGLTSDYTLKVKTDASGTDDALPTAAVTGDMVVHLETTTVFYDIRMSEHVSTWSDLETAIANEGIEGFIVNSAIANPTAALTLPARNIWLMSGTSNVSIEALRFNADGGFSRDGDLRLIANASGDAELSEVMYGPATHIRLTDMSDFGGGLLLARQNVGTNEVQYFANEEAAYVSTGSQFLSAWHAGESMIYLTNAITLPGTLSLNSGPSTLVADSPVTLTADAYTGSWSGFLSNVAIIDIPHVKTLAYLDNDYEPSLPSQLPYRGSDSMIVIEFDQPLGTEGRRNVEASVTEAVYDIHYYRSVYGEALESTPLLDFEWGDDVTPGDTSLRIRNNYEVLLEFHDNIYAQLGEEPDAPFVKIFDQRPFMTMVEWPESYTVTEMVVLFSEDLHSDTIAVTAPERLIDKMYVGGKPILPTSIHWNTDEEGIRLVIGANQFSYDGEPIVIKFIPGRVRDETGEDSLVRTMTMDTGR